MLQRVYQTMEVIFKTSLQNHRSYRCLFTLIAPSLLTFIAAGTTATVHLTEHSGRGAPTKVNCLSLTSPSSIGLRARGSSSEFMLSYVSGDLEGKRNPKCFAHTWSMVLLSGESNYGSRLAVSLCLTDFLVRCSPEFEMSNMAASHT